MFPNRWSAVGVGLWIVVLVSIVGCGGSTESTSELVDMSDASGAQDPGSVLTNTPEIAGLIKAEDPGAVVASVNGASITAGQVTEVYPHNPNGSPHGIAGLCSSDGRHLAMMPHPERTAMLWNWGWMPRTWRSDLEASPWLRMFQNAREWSEEVKG